MLLFCPLSQPFGLPALPEGEPSCDYYGKSADEGGGQGAAPGFAGVQDGGSGLFFPLDGAVFGRGQAVPGLDADELGHTGLGPDQGVGELFNVADHAAAGALLVNAQGGGLQIGHAVAVVGEELLVNGQGGDVGRQEIVILLHQACGQAVQTDGRLHLREPQLIVGGHVLVIEGNGESGMVADAEGHLLRIQIFHILRIKC